MGAQLAFFYCTSQGTLNLLYLGRDNKIRMDIENYVKPNCNLLLVQLEAKGTFRLRLYIELHEGSVES